MITALRDHRQKKEKKQKRKVTQLERNINVGNTTTQLSRLDWDNNTGNSTSQLSFGWIGASTQINTQNSVEPWRGHFVTTSQQTSLDDAKRAEEWLSRSAVRRCHVHPNPKLDILFSFLEMKN